MSEKSFWESDRGHTDPDPWRGERELAKNSTDERLLVLLASYQAGTAPYLIMQSEIERRKLVRVQELSQQVLSGL